MFRERLAILVFVLMLLGLLTSVLFFLHWLVLSLRDPLLTFFDWRVVRAVLGITGSFVTISIVVFILVMFFHWLFIEPCLANKRKKERSHHV